MKTGYYWIKDNGKLLIARWDGLQWNHEYGKSLPVEGHTNIVPVYKNWFINLLRKLSLVAISPMTNGCPNGCSCTKNADGSTSVNCNPQSA